MARALLSSRRRPHDTADRLSAVLRRRYAADDAVLVDSGTSALQLALRIAGASCGSARAVVALPAFTCFEVASAAVGVDARIVLYDLVPQSLAPDPESLERALRAGARIVVVSALFGIPISWTALDAQLARHGAVAIEDAAQGHGASWRGRPLGAHASLSVVSFGRGKGWTGGRGGVLLMRGPVASSPAAKEWSARFRTTRSAIASGALAAVAQWSLGRPALYALPAAIPALGLGATIYHPPAAPRAMDAFTAALVLATAQAADDEAAKRRCAACRWRESLTGLGGVRAIDEPVDGAAGYLRFPLRVERGGALLASRPDARRLGIAPSYPTPLHELPAVRTRLETTAARYPGATTLARELMTLPTHSLLSPHDIRAIVDLVRGTDATPERSA